MMRSEESRGVERHISQEGMRMRASKEHRLKRKKRKSNE